MDDDPYDLKRFIEAQEPVIDRVREELRRGRKTSHWMWFVFPQIAGLGFSPMSQKYAIRSLDEARAYLAHPRLGPRLRECVELVVRIPGRSVHDIFGSPDDMKLRSCLTLFSQASDDPVFHQALQRLFEGEGDPATRDLLRQGS